MKIFITGITSFLGKFFLPEILRVIDDNSEIIVLLRHDIPIKDNRVRKIVCDLKEFEKYKQELMDCDYVFHIAANASFKSGEDYHSVNFIPTKKMVDILKENKRLKNLIYISTIGAYDRAKGDNCEHPLNESSLPNPRSEYGKSKLLSENYIKSSGLPYTIIRPGWIYGSDMRANSHINVFVKMVIDGKFVSKLNFPGKVSVIYVKDLAIALANAINNNRILNKSYFAVTEDISIGDIFNLINEKIFGKKIKQIKLLNFGKIFSKIHHILPLAVNNLFLNYLWADGRSFIEDFKLEHVTKIEKGIVDVINSVPERSGYYLITGANSGIGLALAKILHNDRKKLILIDRDINNLSEFEGQKIIKLDLIDLVENDSILDNLINEKIYCLVNNAGIGLKGKFENLNIKDIKKIVYINALAPLILTRKIINNLKRNGGTIVNITSNIAFNPLPGMSLYSATKAFLSNWTDSISYELRETNVVINFVPSGTYTNFQKSCGVKVLDSGKGLLSPDYVAEKIYEAIKRRKNFVILGTSTKVLLIFSKFLPRSIRILMWGKLFEKFR